MVFFEDILIFKSFLERKKCPPENIFIGRRSFFSDISPGFK